MVEPVTRPAIVAATAIGLIRVQELRQMQPIGKLNIALHAPFGFEHVSVAPLAIRHCSPS